jgi:predicted RNase H-like HicB family nuclease
MSFYSAIIYREDDMYVSLCPEIGTASCGHTIEEALNNLIEATELYLEEFPETKEVQPFITIFKVSHAEITSSA